MAGAAASSGLASATTADAQVIKNFALYTHCGIRETRVGSDYYVAEPVMDDGNGNPPRGWDNPSQLGIMTVHSDGTAIFTAGGLKARFVVRRGASDWIDLCS